MTMTSVYLYSIGVVNQSIFVGFTRLDIGRSWAKVTINLLDTKMPKSRVAVEVLLRLGQEKPQSDLQMHYNSTYHRESSPMMHRHVRESFDC